MTPSYVNQKTLDGVTYIAYRNVDNGVATEWVTCNGQDSRCRLKEVWNNPAALKALFEGHP